VRRAIPLRSIRRLGASRNPAAAAALSLRRIEVEFEGGSLLISPRDFQRFVRSVTARQPAVDTTGL